MGMGTGSRLEGHGADGALVENLAVRRLDVRLDGVHTPKHHCTAGAPGGGSRKHHGKAAEGISTPHTVGPPRNGDQGVAAKAQACQGGGLRNPRPCGEQPEDRDRRTWALLVRPASKLGPGEMRPSGPTRGRGDRAGEEEQAAPVSYTAGEMQTGLTEVGLKIGLQEVAPTFRTDMRGSVLVHTLVGAEAATIGQHHRTAGAHLSRG